MDLGYNEAQKIQIAHRRSHPFDRVDEYEVIAESNLHARDLIVRHLTGGDEWKNIRVEDAGEVRDGPERVLGKISSGKRQA